MIRSITPADMDEVKRLHSLYFPDAPIPDFLDMLCAYVVEDEKGIITIAGLEDICECVAVTDLSRSVLDRAYALKLVLNASKDISQRFGYDQIYTFSRSPKWAKRLKRTGFRPSYGEALVLDL